jgi:hypothetical protein
VAAWTMYVFGVRGVARAPEDGQMIARNMLS